MKLKIQTVALALMAMLSVSSMVSCGDDDDSPKKPTETPGGNPSVSDSKIYAYTKSTYWSAVAYTDVTLSELYTEIPDLEMTCEAPKGYTLRLVKESKKFDIHYVYRIVADMPSLETTIGTNENNKYEVKCHLKSASNNSESQISVNWQRFKAPQTNDPNLYKNWYLAEYSVGTNSDWVIIIGDGELDETKKESVTYSPATSPLHISGQTLPDVLASSCNADLFGWQKGENIPMLNYLVGSRFAYPDADSTFGSSVAFINDKKIIAMKAEYSSNGELVKIHYYDFLPE